MHEIYTGIFDDLHPLARAMKAMKEGKALSPSEDAELLARTYRGWAHKVANMFLVEGTVDFDTSQIIGPSLSEVLDPVRENWKEFEVYGIARRLEELQGRTDDRAKRSIDTLRQILEFLPQDVGRRINHIEPEAR